MRKRFATLVAAVLVPVLGATACGGVQDQLEKRAQDEVDKGRQRIAEEVQKGQKQVEEQGRKQVEKGRQQVEDKVREQQQKYSEGQ